MTDKLRVAVLFGGRSGEHEVSLQSAAAVLANLDRAAYEVMVIGITKEGQWWLAPRWRSRRRALVGGRSAGDSLAHPRRGGGFFFLDEGKFGPQVDVFIPILHGPMGEDGTVQGLLELAGQLTWGPG